MNKSLKFVNIFRNSLVIGIITLISVGWTLTETYENYLTRHKIAEGFLIITAIQNQLNEYAKEHAGFATNEKLDNTSFDLPNPFEIKGTYINSVTASKARNAQNITLVATINTLVIPNLVDGDAHPLLSPHLRFIGHYDGSKIIWSCNSDLAQRYLPNNCKGT